MKRVALGPQDAPFSRIMPAYPQHDGCNQKQKRQHRQGIKQDVEDASHWTRIVLYSRNASAHVVVAVRSNFSANRSALRTPLRRCAHVIAARGAAAHFARAAAADQAPYPQGGQERRESDHQQEPHAGKLKDEDLE